MLFNTEYPASGASKSIEIENFLFRCVILQVDILIEIHSMSRKNRTYKTHNNGSTPFFVEVGKTIAVYKNMDTYDMINGKWVNIKTPRMHLFTLTPERFFGGKGSVLLQLKSNYRFIGHIIYDFTPVKGDTIVSFHSKIGNSDVDYPYAIGKTHVYILLDKVAVEKSYFQLKEDIYDQYYDEHKVKMCLKNNPKSVLCSGNYKEQIHEFHEKKVTLKTKIIQK